MFQRNSLPDYTVSHPRKTAIFFINVFRQNKRYLLNSSQEMFMPHYFTISSWLITAVPGTYVLG